MKKAFLFLLIWLMGHVAFSQPINPKFSVLNSDMGLSQNTVNRVYQDQKGYLWFCTGDGLNKYDGYNCTIFKYDANDSTSISSNAVAWIDEDSQGNLWIVPTGGAICMYNEETRQFHRYSGEQYGDPENLTLGANRIFADKDDRIWITISGYGVAYFDQNAETYKFYPHGPFDISTIGSNSLFGIMEDNEGNIWFSGSTGDLSQYQPETDDFRRFSHDISTLGIERTGIIGYLYEDNDGIFWIGTAQLGLFSFDPETTVYTHYETIGNGTGTNSNSVSSVWDDGNGNLWITTDGGGINFLNKSTGEFTYLLYNSRNPDGLTTNAIYSFYIDRSGTIWFGTVGTGLCYYNEYRSKFEHFSTNPYDDNSLSFNNVTAILEDNDGDVWIGTDGGGLNKFDPSAKSFERFVNDPDDPFSIPTNVIIHLMQDPDGDIFMGTWGKGMVTYNKTTGTFKQYLNDPDDPTTIGSNNTFYYLYDSYGEYWVTTLLGNTAADRFDKETETFSHYYSDSDNPAALPSASFTCMCEDTESNIWLGGLRSGLYRYNRSTNDFTGFPADDQPGSVSSNSFNIINLDSKSRLWFGSANGLNLYDPETETFKVYTVEDGLCDNTINGILEDNNGFLWLTTNKGLSKFDPENLTFRNFDKTDGLQGNEYNYTSQWKATDGTLYFGGKSGFDMFNPDDIKDNPRKPDIVITDVKILNESLERVPVKINGKKTEIWVTEVDELKLSYKQNIVTFEFAALDYANPEKNRYKYMLEGFDKDWVETSADKRFATYTNLNGGTYTFRVMGSNNDGIWNEEGISYVVKISIPFWKAVWFYLAVVAFLAIAIYSFIKMREQQLRSDKEHLEKELNKGKAEISAQLKEIENHKEEINRRDLMEKESKWLNEGLVKFTEIISKNKEDLKALSRSIINTFVDYLEMQKGAIYIINDNDSGDIYLEMISAFGVSIDNQKDAHIIPGEGLVGTCFNEGKITEIDEVPPEYMEISSGLGNISPGYLLLVPVRMDELIIGVIELASFRKVESYKVGLVEKVASNMTSVISIMKASTASMEAIEAAKQQNEELRTAEEEMKQNMEEMQATQEDLKRQAEVNEIMQKSLIKEKALLDAVMTNLPDYIYFKDKDGKFIRISNSMRAILGIKNAKEAVGKSEAELNAHALVSENHEAELKIMKTGKGVVDRIENRVDKEGVEQLVSVTRLPLYDETGECIGVFGITKNISEYNSLLTKNKKKK